jgi:hypothetical protein
MNIESQLGVSYIEVFGESVSDLLRGGAAVSENNKAAVGPGWALRETRGEYCIVLIL